MIDEILQMRHSVRRFQEKPVPAEVLQAILEAGRLSASGGNEQSWRFGVVTDPALIADIAAVAYHQRWITTAPLLIALCTVGVSDERGGREIQKQRYPEYAAQIDAMDGNLYWALNQEEHQTKIAGTQMTLAAWERGVGSCWVSRFEVLQVKRLLNLPDGWLPAEILAMGYPENPGRHAPKKPLEELVFYNAFQPSDAVKKG